MTDPGVALRIAVQAVESANLPYMVIGGIANLVWGESRTTTDVDLTVDIEDVGIEGFLEVAERCGLEVKVITPEDLILEKSLSNPCPGPRRHRRSPQAARREAGSRQPRRDDRGAGGRHGGAGDRRTVARGEASRRHGRLG
jgi:hypothetical protein